MSNILDELRDLLISIHTAVVQLPSQIVLGPRQVLVISGLSEINESLGLVRSGEFRAGNNKEPGFGFSGVRIAYPGMLYSGSLWNIVGIKNDVLQFGLDASEGTAYAGGGVVRLNADGIRVIANDVIGNLRSYGFVNGSTFIGGVKGYRDSAPLHAIVVEADSVTGDDSSVILNALAPTGKVASVTATAQVSGLTTRIMELHLDATDDYFRVTSSRFIMEGYLEQIEQSDPAAPASNRSRLFTRDNGAGKTQLCVRFATGAVQVLATEP